MRLLHNANLEIVSVETNLKTPFKSKTQQLQNVLSIMQNAVEFCQVLCKIANLAIFGVWIVKMAKHIPIICEFRGVEREFQQFFTWFCEF